MTHCLVTFLGRTPRVNGDGDYKRVDYRFPDGHVARAAFLGFPLRRWLDADRLVIFGTTGSMWDHVFEGDINIRGNEDQRFELLEDVEAGQVDQERLDALAPHLAAQLDCEVQLKLIPDALETNEQAHLVHMLAEAAEGADRLSVDVTHGFRHLPMLAFAAGLYLRFVKPDLAIQGLWYGSLEPDTGRAAVHDLRGLLEIADWLSALQRHEWLGDYEGIADLVEAERPTLASALRHASFQESIHQGQQARGNIREARRQLDAQPLNGPGALFAPALRQRMSWVDEQALYLRQRRQALGALARSDFLRASLYGFEAFITKLTQQRFESGRINDPSARREAKETFEQAHHERAHWRAYTDLRGLRNVLAHGNQPDKGDVAAALDSRERLRSSLQACFDALLPDERR